MSDGVLRQSMMGHAKCCSGVGRKEFIEATDLRKEKDDVNAGHDKLTTLCSRHGLAFNTELERCSTRPA